MTSFDEIVGDLAGQIQSAIDQKTPLHIRGGGSKDFYVPGTLGRQLDTRVLSGNIRYEPSELVVTAGAGTSLLELERLLAGQGQCLPFEPPHYRWSHAGESRATLGGMVACGLSGPARANAGGVREFVLGLKLINGLGQQLTFGGQVMKNVAGYDVSRLMVGALGTLGVMTEISLKVLPIAPAETTLCFELDQAQALEQLHRWGAQPLPLNASRWESGDSLAGIKNMLFVRLRGAAAAVEAASVRMLNDAAGMRLNSPQAAEQARLDWERCRNHELPFFVRANGPEDALWRLSVPQTAPVLSLPIASQTTMVEWHGGQRWLWAPLGAQGQIEAAAAAVGGSASIFVMPKDSRQTEPGPAGLVTRMPQAGSRLLPVGSASAASAVITRRLRSSFDPHGIFNPTFEPRIHAN
jgi:glycolate oxidase FAD binding subunit